MPANEKVAIVTGGSSGVGRAVSLKLADEGVAIINADISEFDKLGGDATHNIIQKNGGRALFVKTDMGSESDIINLAEIAVKEFGKVDILVNNAGILSATGLFDTTPETWDKIHAVNLRGPFLLSQKVGKLMADRSYGVIVNISSVFGLLGHVASTAYIASKGGLIALTKQMAMELGKFNIRVNAVLPSTVYTGFFKEQRLDNPDAKVDKDMLFDEARLTKLKARSPLREITTPDDIAAAVVFLTSDTAKMITGISLPVDGGILAGRLD